MIFTHYPSCNFTFQNGSNMKNLIILFSSLVLFSNASAQNFNWAFGIGGEGFDDSRGIGTDKEGSIFVSGKFKDEVDFDPGEGEAVLNSGGNSDTYLAKYDAAGNYLWVRHFDGVSDSENLCSDLEVDEDGNVIVVGEFTAQSDFDLSSTKGILNASGRDGYIVKYSGEGDFLWVYHVKGAGEMEIMAITIDENKNIYHTGRFRATQDFGGESISSKGFTDGYVHKLDPEGQHLWVNHFGSTESEAGLNIALKGNDLFVTGYFEETIDFDYGSETDNATSLDNTDGFIQKLDLNGEHRWVITWGGQSLDNGNSLAVADNGDVYVSGRYLNEGYFAPQIILPKVTGGSGFLFKILSDGTKVWVSQCDRPREIGMDSEGHVFVAGVTTIQKFKIGEGVLKRLKFEKLSGTGFNEINRMIIDKEDNILLTGQFFDEIDFDPSESQQIYTAVKWSDGFVLKLSNIVTGLKSINLVEDIRFFPNPVSEGITIESDSFEGDSELVLFSATGQIIHHQTIYISGPTSFNLPRNLHAGFYTFQITQGKKVGIFKFMKI